MTVAEIQAEIGSIFSTHLGATQAVSQTLVPSTVTSGKLYEAYVLSVLIERLAIDEGFSFVLVNGTNIKFKSSPGPINRNYPCIEMRKNNSLVAELWTDVEFLSLSFSNRQAVATTNGDYHELDIVVVPPGLSGRPRHDEVWLGVECKNTTYGKSLLKEILGVRRELSYLSPNMPTNFTVWPRSYVPASPASCLLVYANDSKVLNYSAPGSVFGIDFFHEPM
jgi:hypothetical protein